MSVLDFSVILCSFNRAQTLKRCLKSFCCQTMPNERWEMVLVNDGSTDETENIVQDFGSPFNLRYITQKNTGLAGARNTAICSAKGKYLLFINDDTIADPNLIRKHGEAHNQHENMLVLGSFEYEPWTLNSAFMQAVAKSTVVFGYPDLVPGEVYDYMFSYTCNLSAPAYCYQEAGLFNTSFRSYGAEDTEMGYRLEKLGYRVLYFPDASAAHAHVLTLDEFIGRQVNVGGNFARLFRIHPEVARQPRWGNLSQMSRFQLECHLETQAENTKKAELYLRDIEVHWKSGSADQKKDIVNLVLPLLKQISSHYWTVGLIKGMRNENLESFYELEDRRLPKAAGSSKLVFERGIGLSVIIPSYNRLRVLQQCLSALKEQTLAPDKFEVLVCDDGSTDGTRSFMETFSAPFPILYLPARNQGPGAARNRGIAAAGGKIALIINDDTILAHDALEKHLDCHQDMHPREVAVLGGYWTSPDYSKNPIQCVIDELFFPREELERNRFHDFRAFWTCNLSLPLKMLQEIGGFDESFYLPASEDTDLGIRLSERYGLKILYRPDIHAIHQHQHSFDTFKRSCIVRGRMTYHLVVKHPWLIPRWFGVSEFDGNGVAKFREILKTISVGTENLETNFRALEQLFSQNYSSCDQSVIRRIAPHYRQGLAKLHHYYNRFGTLFELDQNQQKLNMLVTDNHFFKHTPLRNSWDDRKTFSVILPATNVDQDLKDSIASLKHQTLRSWETIIVDRSREGVCRNIAKEMVLKSFACHYLHHPEGGIASSIQSAVEMASGQLLMVLKPGTIVEENFLRIVYENSRDNLTGIFMPNEMSASGNRSHAKDCYGSIPSQFSLIPSALWRRFFPDPALDETWWPALCENVTGGGFPIKRIPRAVVKCPSGIQSYTPEVNPELSLTEAIALLMISPDIGLSLRSAHGQIDPHVATRLTDLGRSAKGNGHKELSKRIDEIVQALRETNAGETISGKKKLLISVVIPTYNRKVQLDQCLKMLSKQSLAPDRFEVIVVDDGSRDGTEEKVASGRYPFKHRYLKQENSGPGSARNIGVKYAEGDLILFLGDDIYAAPDLLAEHVKHHQNFSNDTEVLLGHIDWAPELAVSAFMHFITCPTGAQFAFGSISDEENVDYLYFYTSNISIKKRFLCSEDPIFDGNFRFAAYEDIDLGFRLKLRGMRLRYRPGIIGYHDHPTTIAQFADRQHRAGQMAVVFARKHPGSSIALEIDQFLQPGFAAHEKWSRSFTDQRLREECTRLEAVARAEGSLDYETNLKLRQLWSEILQRSYIQGVLSEVSRQRQTCNTTASMDVKASIIIPNYNQCELLKKCLASIQRCTPAGQYEIIVVDNGSTDTSVDFLREYERSGRAQCIFNRRNLGFAVGCNQGAGLARGTYLLFLNNDTEVQSGWFENLTAVAEGDETIGVVGSKLLFPDGSIQHAGVAIIEAVGRDPLLGTHVFYKAPGNLADANKRMIYQAVTAACMLVRKKAFQAVKGFDEKYWNGYEDVDFCLQLQEIGWITVYEPASIVIHHESQSGPERFKQSKQNIKRFHEKWLGKTKVDFFNDHEGKFNPAPTSKIREYHTAVSSMISIIVLTYNQLQYTKKCVSSIRANTLEPHEIIFVDNGSTDGTVEWLRKLTQNNRRYRVIENGNNLGFARGCNQGIAVASGEFIVLLNNDVIVTEGWLTGMMDCLCSASDTGIVGPMTNRISGVQQVPGIGYSKIEDLNRYAKEFRRRNQHRRVEHRRIVGFCQLFRKKLVQEIGLLDESFGTGNFEDDDFCMRSILAGYRNLIAGDVFIHHYGSRSFIGNQIDYRSSISGNRSIFNSKWAQPGVLQRFGSKPIVLDAVLNAESLNRRGQIDQAVSRILDAIKRAPGERALIHCLAQVLVEGKQFREAQELLESMPGMPIPQAYILLGNCAEGQGQENKADEYVQKALAIDPANAKAINLKGTLEYRRGNKDVAERLFRQALQIDPGCGESYTNLGVVKWEAGEREEGFHLFERGFILSPTDYDVCSSYHSVAVDTGHCENAEVAFREAVALYPEDRRLSSLYISLLLQLEKFQPAMAEIERAMAAFGIDDQMLAAALQVRERVGPMEIIQRAGVSSTLAVCMIVRNEQDHLIRCIMSIKEIADEIIVVDTGSTDKTKAIACALGAKVFDFPWTHDFSEARNYSLEKASAEWILVLDADEVISIQDHDKLKALLRKKMRRVAYTMVTRNYTDQAGAAGWVANEGIYMNEEAGKGWLPSPKVRLFPNDTGVKFVHAVHELVEPTLERLKIMIKPCDVPIHHYGRLDRDKVLAKGKEYYQLGIQKLQNTVGSYDAYKEFAIQACEIGEYETAVNAWQKAIEINSKDAVAFMNMGFAFLMMGQYDKALETSKKAIELNPELREAALNLAGAEMMSGNVPRAISTLKRIIAKNVDYPPALGRLAAALLISDQKQEGLHYLKTLKSNGFDGANMLEEQAREFLKNGNTEKAVVLLEAAIESGGSNSRINQLLDETRPKANHTASSTPSAGLFRQIDPVSTIQTC